MKTNVFVAVAIVVFATSAQAQLPLDVNRAAQVVKQEWNDLQKEVGEKDKEVRNKKREKIPLQAALVVLKKSTQAATSELAVIQTQVDQFTNLRNEVARLANEKTEADRTRAAAVTAVNASRTPTTEEAYAAADKAYIAVGTALAQAREMFANLEAELRVKYPALPATGDILIALRNGPLKAAQNALAAAKMAENTVAAQIIVIESAVTSLEADLATLQRRFASASRDYAGMEASIQTARSAADIAARMATKDDVTKIATELGEMRKDVRIIGNEIRDLRRDLRPLTEEVAKISPALATTITQLIEVRVAVSPADRKQIDQLISVIKELTESQQLQGSALNEIAGCCERALAALEKKDAVKPVQSGRPVVDRCGRILYWTN